LTPPCRSTAASIPVTSLKVLIDAAIASEVPEVKLSSRLPSEPDDLEGEGRAGGEVERAAAPPKREVQRALLGRGG
jgi:hypothetical protein